jgi:hypothetical protein
MTRKNRLIDQFDDGAPHPLRMPKTWSVLVIVPLVTEMRASTSATATTSPAQHAPLVGTARTPLTSKQPNPDRVRAVAKGLAVRDATASAHVAGRSAS